MNPLCFGVCCPVHGTCARYLGVDACPRDAKFIGTCGAARPLFIPIQPVKVNP